MTSWAALAAKLIAPFEGCERRKNDGLIYPYLDKLAKPHVWTRGYGRTYGISEASGPITRDAAADELEHGVRKYGLRCVAMAPNLAQREPCLAAATSWAWNCGLGAFRWSRFRKAICEGRWTDAANQIRTPRTAGGVVYRGLARRRDAEHALFLLGIDAG